MCGVSRLVLVYIVSPFLHVTISVLRFLAQLKFLLSLSPCEKLESCFLKTKWLPFRGTIERKLRWLQVGGNSIPPNSSAQVQHCSSCWMEGDALC